MPPWEQLEDEDLLQWRIRDLQLQIEGTKIEKRIRDFHAELDEKGFVFKPPCYLADEWFVMEDEVGIGIPFYLSNKRLEQLEEKMVLDVEGRTYKDFLKLIRHEAGHAFCHAYGLHRRKKFASIFGKPGESLPKTFRPKPYSRNFVRHLDNWYSQIDPEEDFAETFAVWLNPSSHWQEQYRGWKASAKLDYVDSLMQEIKAEAPKTQVCHRPCGVSQLKLRLKTYYQKKRREFEEEYPDFFDSDLKRLFSEGPASQGRESARRFMQRHRKSIVYSIARWTNEKKFAVHHLYQRLSQRCGELSLQVCYDDNQTIADITALLTALVSNRIYTGKTKRGR